MDRPSFPAATPLATPLLVASDLHLSSQDPAGIERFLRFAAGPCTAATSLILAGDLFEVWTTPSQRDDPGVAPVFQAIRRLVDRGVSVAFVEGNRDFAASPELRAAGVAVLADVVVVESSASNGRPLRVVITHGDRLCTKDTRYQAFRRIARSEIARHLLRAAPAALAERSGRAARAGSRMETARKTYGDMGLDPLAVADILRAGDADALICGHVHWGRRHGIVVDGRARDVVVLGAWDSGDGSFARLDGNALTFERFA